LIKSLSGRSVAIPAPQPSIKVLARNVRAKTREDLALPIERQVIVELGDEDMGDQTGAEHAAIDRTRRRGRLHDFLAAPAGFPETHGLDYLQFSGDVVEHL
jgi:hypothetical protein